MIECVQREQCRRAVRRGANSAVRKRSGSCGRTSVASVSSMPREVARIGGTRKRDRPSFIAAPRLRGGDGAVSCATPALTGNRDAGHGTAQNGAVFARPVHRPRRSPMFHCNQAEDANGFRTTDPALLQDRARGARHVRGNARPAPRQAPSGLCHGAERLRREGRVAAGQVARGHRQGHGGRRRTGVQQCRPALEPHRVLAVHEPDAAAASRARWRRRSPPTWAA